MSDVENRANEIADAKVQDIAPKDETKPDVLSPLEEARKLKEDLSRISEDMKKERQEIERHRAEMQLSGNSFAGQKPLTEEEKAKERAQSIIKNYLG